MGAPRRARSVGRRGVPRTPCPPSPPSPKLNVAAQGPPRGGAAPERAAPTRPTLTLGGRGGKGGEAPRAHRHVVGALCCSPRRLQEEPHERAARHRRGNIEMMEGAGGRSQCQRVSVSASVSVFVSVSVSLSVSSVCIRINVPICIRLRLRLRLSLRLSFRDCGGGGSER